MGERKTNHRKGNETLEAFEAMCCSRISKPALLQCGFRILDGWAYQIVELISWDILWTSALRIRIEFLNLQKIPSLVPVDMNYRRDQVR
jgi:hypothetical protein